MSQDGLFIRKLSEELHNKLSTGRIDSAYGLNKTDYILVVRAKGENHSLYLSVSYNNPTIFSVNEKFEKPGFASPFTMVLRKYLVGSFIESIKQLNNDRVIEITCTKKDDLLGNTKLYLVIELIGRFSNLLLLDEDRKIIDAIKQLSILENESRGIMKKMTYIPLKNEKISIDDKDEFNKLFINHDNQYPKNLVDNISGVSPKLAEYLIKNYKDSKDNFYDYVHKEIDKFNPTYIGSDFYYFDIFENQNKEYFDSLNELLYHNYKENAETKILKDNNHKLYQCVNSNIKRLEKKLINLNNDLTKDLDSENYKIKGEVLMANSYLNIKGKHLVELTNFYNNETIKIDIDPSKSMIDNANNYFKKYKKSKAALEHLNEQISIAEKELDYFKLLSYQLGVASLKDLEEIKDELIKNKYISEKYNTKKSKQKVKPNFLEITFKDCRILVGKNNLQNEFITHHIGRKDDLWFHVKNSHGSHVLVQGDNKYSEDVIRKAAYLAATYSEAKDSSSVPVDYTLIKNIKKIPGRSGSFVSYKGEKTIYIDPNNK